VAQRRHHDDARGRVVGQDILGHLHAIDVVDGDIQRHQVRPQLFVLLDGLGAVVRLAADLVAMLREHALEHQPHEQGIVNHQDSLAHGCYTFGETAPSPASEGGRRKDEEPPATSIHPSSFIPHPCFAGCHPSGLALVLL
jgi:hypothetical protein